MTYPKQVWEYDKEELAEMYAIAQCEIERMQAALSQIDAVCMDYKSAPTEFIRGIIKRVCEQKTGMPDKCIDCGENYADPPSKLCPGCQAYREHQQ